MEKRADGKLKSRRGFTLIELLVVVAIIAILAAILFPVYTSSKRQATRAACISNFKQFALAVDLYAQDNNGAVVPARINWISWNQTLSKYTRRFLSCPDYKVTRPRANETPASLALYCGYQMNANLTNSYETSEGNGQVPVVLDRIRLASKSPLVIESDGYPSANPYGGWPGGGGWFDPRFTHNDTACFLMADCHVVSKASNAVDWKRNMRPFYWHFQCKPYD